MNMLLATIVLRRKKINKTNKYLDLKISFRLLYFGQYIAIFRLSVLANNRTHFTY